MKSDALKHIDTDSDSDLSADLHGTLGPGKPTSSVASAPPTPATPSAARGTVLDTSPASMARSPLTVAAPLGPSSSPGGSSMGSHGSSPSPGRSAQKQHSAQRPHQPDSSDGSDDDVMPAARNALHRSQLAPAAETQSPGATPPPRSGHSPSKSHKRAAEKAALAAAAEAAAEAKAHAEHKQELALQDEYAEALAVPAAMDKGQAAQLLHRLRQKTQAAQTGVPAGSRLEARRLARLGLQQQAAPSTTALQCPPNPAAQQADFVDLSDSDDSPSVPINAPPQQSPASEGDSQAVQAGSEPLHPRGSPKSDETVAPVSDAATQRAAPTVLTGGDDSQAMDTASMLSLGAAFSRVDPVLAALLAANNTSLKDFDAASAERVLGSDLKAMLSGNAPGAGGGMLTMDADGATAVKLSALPGAGSGHGRMGSMLQQRYSGVVMTKSRVGGTVGLSGASGRAQLRASLKHTRQLQEAHAQARASGYKNALAASIARRREAERATKRMLALREAKAAAQVVGDRASAAAAAAVQEADAPAQEEGTHEDPHTTEESADESASQSAEESDTDVDEAAAAEGQVQGGVAPPTSAQPSAPSAPSAAVKDDELFGDSESDDDFLGAAPDTQALLSASAARAAVAVPAEGLRAGSTAAASPLGTVAASMAHTALLEPADAASPRPHAALQSSGTASPLPAAAAAHGKVESPKALQPQGSSQASETSEDEDDDVVAAPAKRRALTYKEQVEADMAAETAQRARRKAAAAAGESNLLADEASEGEEEEGALGGALGVGMFGQGRGRGGGDSDDEEAALQGIDLDEELKHVVDELDADEEDKNVVDTALLRKQRRMEDDDMLRRLTDGVQHGMLESRARGAAGARVQGALDAEEAEVAALGDDEEALEAYYAKQLAMGRRGGAERVTAEDADLAASDAEFDDAGDWVGGGISDLDDTDSDSAAGYDVEKALQRALSKRAAAERRLVARAKQSAAEQRDSQSADAAQADSQGGDASAGTAGRSELRLRRGEKRCGGAVGLTRSGKRRRGLLLRTEGTVLVDEETTLLPTIVTEQPAVDGTAASHSPADGASQGGSQGQQAATAAPSLVRHGSHVEAMLAMDEETRTVADGLISISAASLKQAAEEASRPPPAAVQAPAPAPSSSFSMADALRAVVAGGCAGVQPAPTAAPPQHSAPAAAAVPPLVRSSSLAGIDLSSLMGGSNSRFTGSTATPQLARSATTGGLSVMGTDYSSRAGVSMTFGFGVGTGASRQGPADSSCDDASASRSATAAAASAAAAGRVKSGNTRAFVFTSAKQRPPTKPKSSSGDAIGGGKRNRAPSSQGTSQLGSLFGQGKPRV